MGETIYKFEREMLCGEDIRIQKKSDHNWYKKHWHNYFEIIYYKGCEGSCTLNGIKHELSESCLFFLTPKDFHEISTKDIPESYSLIISFSEQIADKELIKDLSEEPVVLYGLPELLSFQLEELYEVFRGRSAYRDAQLRHLLNCILISILERGQRVPSAPKDIHPAVRESISYMLTNPAEQITLGTFASKFGITGTYFSHLFHESTGVSFKQYLTSLRMECAKRMLRESELPIIDVCFECGFLTPSQFTRSFKAHTGMTPSQFRADNALTSTTSCERIINDKRGAGSVMVYIKKFYLDQVINGAAHVPHPAFVVGDRELDGIYISKYQNTIIDGLAYSLYDRDPTVCIDLDSAARACSDKGKGFHLMSAAEWSAVALLCLKSGALPYGNNGMGKDIREDSTVARISFFDEKNSVCRVATGTGPASWSHNGRPDGIYDLNGNVWEWVSGLRLVYGELQFLPDISRCPDNSADSRHWYALDGSSGRWIEPDGSGTTPNSVKLDSIDGTWRYVTGKLSSCLDEIRFCDLASVTADTSVCRTALDLLRAYGCLPCGDTSLFKGVSLYANNGAAERVPFRGGRWGQGLNSGVFKTCLDDPRDLVSPAIGFRSAYYEI